MRLKSLTPQKPAVGLACFYDELPNGKATFAKKEFLMLVKWGTGRPAVGLLQACKCSTYPGPSDSTFVMPWIHLALSSPQNG